MSVVSFPDPPTKMEGESGRWAYMFVYLRENLRGASVFSWEGLGTRLG